MLKQINPFAMIEQLDPSSNNYHVKHFPVPRLNLPICLHVRQADEDGLKILDEAKLPKNYRIHLHCFNSHWQNCKMWMEKYPNLKVGFTPMITYEKNRHLHEVVREIPLERVLLETDSPYFLPRQEPNSQSGISHPGYVIHTAAQIALLKNVPIEGKIMFFVR